ncbi:UNVERIFIED_CONTAM: TetR/AcrR family transcriptional regulator [Halobacillus marinus]
MFYILSEQWLINEGESAITPRKPIEQQVEQEAILNVARDLFVKKGFRDVSMRKIAAELEMSHGMIYYHFNNKAGLFYAVVAKDFALLDEILEEIMKGEADPVQKLKHLFVAYMKFGIDYSSHYEMMFLIKDEQLNTLMNEEPNRSYERFAKAVAALVGPKCATTQSIWSAFLSLHGFVVHYYKTGQTFNEMKSLVEGHAEFIIKSLDI